MKSIKKQKRNDYDAPRLRVHQISPQVCIAVSLGGFTESFDGTAGATENYSEEKGTW